MRDLTAHDMPTFGELTDRERGAMIRAWHNGRTIQCHRYYYDGWDDNLCPSWTWSVRYRVKPIEYVPGVLYQWSGGACPVDEDTHVSVVYNRTVDTGPARVFEWGHDGEDNDIVAFMIKAS